MFGLAITKALNAVRDRSTLVHPSHWQAIDVSKMPEAATHEVLNYTLQAQVSTEDLKLLGDDIKPNLPWADDHFLERVGGKPLNPGVQWAKWPWGNVADKSRNVPNVLQPNGELDNGFSHTYMERMWPKDAGKERLYPLAPHRGIRYEYGDIRDTIQQLLEQPLTRQAFVPLWFPEDTGKTTVRVPCTLGYHFIMRAGYLHCTYYIRSCDIYRHMRDDIYLTVRLLLWVLNELRSQDPDAWGPIKPGIFTMHIVSLHCFRNDYTKLFGKQP